MHKIVDELCCFMQNFRDIVRLAGTNIDGTKKLPHALTEIKGVGIRLALVIVNQIGLDPNSRLGFLPDKKIERIEDSLENLEEMNLPAWFLNRRKDRESGKNLHFITSELDLTVRSDIDQMKNMKSWKGFRHTHGLKVRGQKTRTTGRKRRSVGVKKRRIIAQRRAREQL